MSQIEALNIPCNGAGQVLTPEQKRFNTLIRQIAQARETLAAWQEGIGLYKDADARVLRPLRTALADARRQWAFALDGLLAQSGWTKDERRTLRAAICDVAGVLLNAKTDDQALQALYEKHAGVDFETDRKEMLQVVRGMTEAMTGLDLGDDDLDDEDALLRRMHEKMQEQASAAEAERAERAARRRKTAAQQRREAEAKQATQSVREIFRKLAAVLHPDRETDPAQRERKTALMQRANAAYESNDLLTLLELQLQIEHVDAGHAATASAQRLKHYNKVLSEQLAELKAEIGAVGMAFCVEFDLDPAAATSAPKLGLLVDGNARGLRGELAQVQRDLRMLADRVATKRWLKSERQTQREAEDFGFF